MEITDTRPYITAMEQVKRRVDVILACNDGRLALNGPPRVETAALQLRMTLETIALASLAANKELFQQQSLRFEKHWKPSEIIRDLERLNPRFYPTPIREGEPDAGGVRTHEPLLDGFLTKDELLEAHGRCGDLLHTRNPFRPTLDYSAALTNVVAWTHKVIRLLNAHEIRLLGEDHFHLVHMSVHGNDSVHMYTFAKVDA
ncbi:hypothetical protein HDE76_001239 [Rhodanobacter sp. ANJX3]|jgi:hypothetical protein|uniref:hypothetical protein n=1 Tax=Rhodanobacter sp. ANJX3 TaxID=2723083 RepID=UPI001622D64A|nr:hypothetical protein [Rhodanobacter sp. ANJX3]MBB5358033.1 hypothetical protein [Rhodanobacter sp. ANJX3]